MGQIGLFQRAIDSELTSTGACETKSCALFSASCRCASTVICDSVSAAVEAGVLARDSAWAVLPSSDSAASNAIPPADLGRARRQRNSAFGTRAVVVGSTAMKPAPVADRPTTSHSSADYI